MKGTHWRTGAASGLGGWEGGRLAAMASLGWRGRGGGAASLGQRERAGQGSKQGCMQGGLQGGLGVLHPTAH